MPEVDFLEDEPRLVLSADAVAQLEEALARPAHLEPELVILIKRVKARN